MSLEEIERHFSSVGRMLQPSSGHHRRATEHIITGNVCFFTFSILEAFNFHVSFVSFCSFLLLFLPFLGFEEHAIVLESPFVGVGGLPFA